MKALKLIIPVAGLLMASATLHSQTIYDVTKLSGSELNGTARFVGMGGAMGALGGDISTMGTNPAGIGIFRSSDLNVSFGFSNVGTKSKFRNYSSETDDFYGSFDNAGFVLALKQGNHTPVRFVNFGFNYRKIKSFDRNVNAGGTYDYSQTEYFAELMRDNMNAYDQEITTEELSENGVFDNEFVPWLAPLVFKSNLIFYNDDITHPYPYLSYMSDGYDVNSNYHSRERGGIHSYDFNLAMNVYDRFYIGATIGVYSVDYRRNTSYSEAFLDGGQDVGNYTLSNDYEIDGTGVDFKLGVIFRPVESSPFRIGLAFSTPTFYNLSAYQATSLRYNTQNAISGEFEKGTVTPHNSTGSGGYTSVLDYKMVTPWKFNFSLGHTIGSSVALGAEYEYMTYTSSRLKYDDGEKMYTENEQVKDGLKGTHTLRLGAEVKVAPEFSLRAGYNHITSPLYSDSFKNLPVNSVRTDTDYANTRSTNNYTLGFGYRGDNFYADMAYQYHTYEEDFYAFFLEQHAQATKITTDRHQLLFTLGMRF